jgi:hypothetical protein
VFVHRAVGVERLALVSKGRADVGVGGDHDEQSARQDQYEDADG